MPGPVILLAVSLTFVAVALALLRSSGRRTTAFLIALLVFVDGVLSIAYFVADYFTGHGIDESVFLQLFSGFSGAGFGAYHGLFLATAGALALALGLSVLAYRVVRGDSHGRGISRRRSLAGILLVGSFVLHPTVRESAQYFMPWRHRGGAFAEHYRTPRLPLRTATGRNLVYLYGEGIERSYMDESVFPDVTPELRRLERRAVSFTGLRSVWGTGNTIAGMVASQCGIPLVTTGSLSNSMGGMPEFLPGATCLGDVLAQDGYHLVYMGGASLSFAGKGKFYRSHGFHEVYGLDALSEKLPDPSYRSAWGLHDDSLLDMAYDRFEQLSEREGRFGLFLLTLDTHHPDGFATEDCRRDVPNAAEMPILSAVACADQLIAHFVDRILASKYASNTMVVIGSDHLALSNSAWKVLTRMQRSDLLMVISPDVSTPALVTTPGSTLDVAPTLLSMLGYHVDGFGLGRSLLGAEPTLVMELANPNPALIGWQRSIRRLWRFPALTGLTIRPEAQEVDLGGQTLRLPLLVGVDDDLEVNRLGFALARQQLGVQVDRFTSDQLFIWIDACKRLRPLDSRLGGGGLCVFAGKMGGVETLALQVRTTTRIEKEEIRRLAAAPTSESLYRERGGSLGAALAPQSEQWRVPGLRSPHEITIRSCGGPTRRSGILVNGDDAPPALLLQRGLSLIGVTAGGDTELLSHVDAAMGPAAVGAAQPFSAVMHERAGDFVAFAIVCADSPARGRQDLSPLFSGLDLEQWRGLGFRQPYIALAPAAGGTPHEVVGNSETTVTVRLIPGLSPSAPGT